MKLSLEVSPDVRKLVEYLDGRKSATYEDMNVHVGRKLNGRDRYVLHSAMRILERGRKMFVAERGVGVRRATNGQTATLSTDTVISKTRRVVRRGRKRQELVNTQELQSDERDAFFIGRAVTQMIDATVGRTMRSKIAHEIEDRGEAVDVKDIIGLFSKRAH